MSHHGTCCANEWATAPETMELLQSLLAQPLSEVLGIGDALPLGGLCDAHILELFALAEDVQSHFDVDYADKAYILHVYKAYIVSVDRLSSVGGVSPAFLPPSRWEWVGAQAGGVKSGRECLLCSRQAWFRPVERGHLEKWSRQPG